MRPVILVNSVPHLRSLMRHNADLLKTHLPLTADMGVAAACEAKGMSFLELWDYLSDAELEQNWETAWALSRTWHGLADDELECHGAHPLRSSHVEMLLPLETALNANQAIERVLEAERPTSLLGNCDLFPIYRSGPVPVYRGTAAVAEAVMRWRCDERGIPFGISPQPPPPLKGTRRASLGASRIPMATRIGEKEAPSPDKPLLMIVDLGQNPRELFALELELRRSNRFRLIRISELLRAGYPLSIPLGEGIRAAVLAAEQKSRQARAKYAGPYPFIFANRHLGFQFDGAWREVLRSCEVSAFFEPLLRQIRPDVVLLGADCFTAEGLIRDIAQRCGILVGSLLHSGLSPRRGWRELGSSADVVFTWGEIDRASLLDHGARPEQLASVGSLRYPRGTESLTHTSPEHRERVRTRLGIAQPRVVSFLTGATNFGLAVSSCQPRIHRDAFRAVLAWAESHPDVALLVKPHPSYDHLEWYRALSATFPGNVRLLEGESLADVVAVTDVPVLFNYCTTAALEPLVTAPIVYARIGYRTTPLLRSSIDDTVLAATNVPELVGHIERLLAPQSKLAEECLRRQKAFSRRMFGDLGRHPATVIADVLDERLAARHVEGLASPAPKGPVIDVSRQSAWLDELWRSGASSAVEQWGAVVRRTQGQDRTAFLLASAVTVGATAMAPEQIRAALRAFRSTATAEAGDLGRRFLTALCATAMIGAVGRHRWLDVVSLASDALRCSARDPTSMRLMVRLLGKAAISFGVSDARALFTLVGAATRLGDGSFA